MELEEQFVDGTYEALNWRKIPGYNGMYEISVDGEIISWQRAGRDRHLPPKKMEPYRQKSGKVVVSLTKDGKKRNIPVAQLMAITFLGGIRPGKTVCHRNQDITDNRLSNICFMERSKNQARNGGNNRRPVLKIDKNGNIIDVYRSVKEAAKKNYVCKETIIEHCKRRLKQPFKFQDYTFRYDR